MQYRHKINLYPGIIVYNPNVEPLNLGIINPLRLLVSDLESLVIIFGPFQAAS